MCRGGRGRPRKCDCWPQRQGAAGRASGSPSQAGRRPLPREAPLALGGTVPKLLCAPRSPQKGVFWRSVLASVSGSGGTPTLPSASGVSLQAVEGLRVGWAQHTVPALSGHLWCPWRLFSVHGALGREREVGEAGLLSPPGGTPQLSRQAPWCRLTRQAPWCRLASSAFHLAKAAPGHIHSHLRRGSCLCTYSINTCEMVGGPRAPNAGYTGCHGVS